MQIEFGQDVYSSDGKKLGSVAGLVVDSGTKEVRRLVIGEGLFHQDERLVDISAVQSVDGKRLNLDVTEAAAASLPEFVREEYVDAPRTPPEGVFIPAGGVGGPVLYDSSLTATGYTDYPGGKSFFEMAPVDPPVVETRSNLEESEVMLKAGTDVIGSDGKKVGTVDEVIFGDRESITGFVVKAGFLFTHDVQIPIAWVAEVDDDRVHLNVTSDAARQGR